MPTRTEVVAAFVATAKRRKRGIAGVTCSIAVLAATAAAVFWLGNSSRFEVEGVETTGRHWLPEASLNHRVALDESVNLFRFNIRAAVERIQASPWVKRATITRTFPNLIRVDLTENIPIALALIGELYLIDAEGMPFKRASVSEAAALGQLVVTGISREQYRTSPREASARMAEAVSIASAWQLEPGRMEIVEINIDEVRGFTLIPHSGRPAIRIGAGSRHDVTQRGRLFDRAWALLTSDERRAVESVHLDTAPTPERVAIAFATPAGPEKEKKQHQWAN